MILPLPIKLTECIERLETVYGQNILPALSYIQTGIIEFDDAHGGIPRVGISLIASERAHANTSFALSIARNAAINQDITTIIIDTQRNGISVAMRLIAQISQIPISFLVTACINDKLGSDDNTWGGVTHALSILNETPILVEDDKISSITDLITSLTEIILMEKIGLIVIDGLNFEDNNSSAGSDFQRLFNCYRQLNSLSFGFNIPIVLTSQIPQIIYKDEKRLPPSLADFTFNQIDTAGLLMIPYWPNSVVQENRQPKKTKLAVFKPKDDHPLLFNVDFNPETGTFQKLDNKDELYNPNNIHQ